MEQWEWEEEQELREVETVRRLHRLKRRGYEIDWTIKDADNAFFMDHLGNGPNLIFYPSGMIVAPSSNLTINSTNGEDSDRILNQSKHDNKKFDRWLETVDSPTWWQKGAPNREKYIYVPAVWIVFIVLIIVINELVEWLYASFFA